MQIDTSTQVCIDCNQDKPMQDFTFLPCLESLLEGKDEGIHSIRCDECTDLLSAQLSVDPDKQREYMKAYAQTSTGYKNKIKAARKYDQSEKGQRNHSNQRHTRRALLRNAYVEPVDRFAIYKRDNGICGICHKKINVKFKSPHPKSFCLDHIVPIICNGSHEPKNVQSAHKGCNSRKAAKAYWAQLRLS